MPIFSFIGNMQAAQAQEKAGELQAQTAREGTELNRQIANLGLARNAAGTAAGEVSLANLLSLQGYEIPDVRLANPEAQISQVAGQAFGNLQEGQDLPTGVGGVEAFDPSGRRLKDIQTTSFEGSPGFRFRQEEGNRAVQSSAAARGLLGSGGTLRDLSRFNQGLASQEFGNEFNRRATLAGMGQAATDASNKTASNFGQLGAQGLSAAGQAIAQGTTNAANTRATAFSNLGQGIVGFAGGL